MSFFDADKSLREHTESMTAMQDRRRANLGLGTSMSADLSSSIMIGPGATAVGGRDVAQAPVYKNLLDANRELSER